MKKSLPYILGLLIITSCDVFLPEDEDPCGFETVVSPSFLNLGTVSPPDDPHFSFFENNQRIYRWETQVFNDICPEKVVSVDVSFLKPRFAPVQPMYKVYLDYAFFFEKEVPFHNFELDDDIETQTYKGEIDISDGFSNEPGSFKLVMEIILPSGGDAQKDSMNLYGSWVAINTLMSFHETK